MVDVGQRLASLGLVLLEFIDVKPVKKLESDSNLLLTLEKLSSILRQKKVSLEPSILEEISMEHQAIADLISFHEESHHGETRKISHDGRGSERTVGFGQIDTSKIGGLQGRP